MDLKQLKDKLPQQAVVDKFIAKTKFYDNENLDSKEQQNFTNKIQRITWRYKLAENSIGIAKTEAVSEIQIFELELKEKAIPNKILKIIDKAIPYQILYVFTYQEHIAYGITLKDNLFSKKTPKDYYFSDWDEEIEFDFTGINLEKVYQKLITAFITTSTDKDKRATTKQDFNTLVETDKVIKKLEKEILLLDKRIDKEKQFNKKVDLNKILLEKQNRLNRLTS